MSRFEKPVQRGYHGIGAVALPVVLKDPFCQPPLDGLEGVWYFRWCGGLITKVTYCRSGWTNT